MKTETVAIKLEGGLGARPVALLVQEASKYDSRIYVEAEGKKVNAKSIMGMMTLGLDNGEELTVTADGEDEDVAMENLYRFLSGK
ncbi:MAG: HPr family phosphocarrier protein [Lachnospiraceae bacterium]|nr:HPr family phosphocarrier protein [Lachnospiraceae bacterium]